MSVDWESVEAACEQWASSVLGSSAAVCWRKKSSREGVSKPYVELEIDGESEIGTADLAYDEDNRPDVTGLWEFKLQVRCQSREQLSSRTARNYLSKLKTSLAHPLYIGPLNESGVTYLRSEPMRSFSVRDGDREESIALIELWMCTKSRMYESAGKAVDWAETADVAVSVDGDPPVTVQLPES